MSRNYQNHPELYPEVAAKDPDVHYLKPMTPEQRDKLIDDYAYRCVDDMDIKDMCRALAESIAHDFETESDEYVIEQVKQFYPDLLED